MFEKIKAMIQRFKLWHSHESCYTAREDEGYALFGMCGGTVGGTRNTGYLSELYRFEKGLIFYERR